MGSNLVIVALPADDDVVWKVSSEKKPHMTLLFLGDSASNPNVQRIMEFVQHAVDVTEHGPFYLDTDRRDVLGADNADVLFFRKDWSYKWINQFRNQLLQNTDIKTAYDSTEQFPEWQPHLTLGYPEAPANEDKVPDYGFNMVRFDRIAVWTGDFEGPDFRLEWPERSFDDMAEVAWSDKGIDIALERQAAGRYALQHSGVKGMKWGVRNDRHGRNRWSPKGHSLKEDVAKTALLPVGTLPAQVRLAKRAAPHVAKGAKRAVKGLSALGAHLADSSWQASTYSDVRHEAVHNHVAKNLDSHVLTLQTSAKYKGKNLKANSDLRKEYYQDIAKATDKAYQQAVKDTYGSNFTGTKTAHYVNDVRGPRIEVRNKKTGEVDSEAPITSAKDIQRNRSTATHAATAPAPTDEAPDLVIELKIDDNGQISGVGFVPPSDVPAIHGEIFVEELMHFGVKGMKWGVRKAPPAAVSPSATSRVPHGTRRKTKITVEGGENHPAHPDAIVVAKAKAKLVKSGTAALSNHELQAVANRVRLEQQVRVLVAPRGKKFVKGLLGNQGNQAANQVVGQQIKKKLATAALI
jgi:2'-5' RNA ligase